MKHQMRRGYIEGYYGRLLTWGARHRVIDCLSSLGMSDYFYAPKDDPKHRFQWRQPYDDAWRESFRSFTAHAHSHAIRVIGGLAPGLDFDFASLDSPDKAENDYRMLVDKARLMLRDGADEIGLLLDDIDPGFAGHAGGFGHEGFEHEGFGHEGWSHTALANRLAADLDAPLSLTPRLYADTIEDTTKSGGGTLDYIAEHLDRDIKVFTCGHDIVAHDTGLKDTKIVKAGMPQSQLIVWDNLYANDYCPRRLFLGCYQGRHRHQDILLNPTGMIETDLLLLSVMAAGDDMQKWQNACLEHGVPAAFFAVSRAFWLPPQAETPPVQFENIDATLAHLDQLLWQWKAPLQREWYPYLMGLRQDLLLGTGRMDALRIDKSVPPLLAPLVKRLAQKGK